MAKQGEFVRWYRDLTRQDVHSVGEELALLGEVMRALPDIGAQVPHGFVLTSAAFHQFLRENDLQARIRQQLERAIGGGRGAGRARAALRGSILSTPLPDGVREELARAYRRLSELAGQRNAEVVVRLSIIGDEAAAAVWTLRPVPLRYTHNLEGLISACTECYASLFEAGAAAPDSAAADPFAVNVALSVQCMVRSSKAASGVVHTRDTESGFPRLAAIHAGWGIPCGAACPRVVMDEYRVFKPLLDQEALVPIVERRCGTKPVKWVSTRREPALHEVPVPVRQQGRLVLSDAECLGLARWACAIEAHCDQPVTLHWVRDGVRNALSLLRVQPLHVQNPRANIKRYRLVDKGRVLVEGQAIGSAVAAGRAILLRSLKEAHRFQPGAVLVTRMTDPDWLPLMKQAAGIVTDLGGRTSHAAIICREMGIPAVLGTGNGTKVLKAGEVYTVSCAEGDQGRVYHGRLTYHEETLDLRRMPRTRTKVMMIISNPDAALRWWHLPVHGIGLARIEFIVNNSIKIHPLALVHFDQVKDPEARRRIQERTAGYADKTEYFVSELAQGIAKVAASQYPKPVVVRMSDFKSNEYCDLIGGQQFELKEENPMMGFRGASRYYSDPYRHAFALECRALLRVRDEMGLLNAVAMIPFCRTVEEADRVIETLAENGLVRGERGFEVYMMAEVPANVILADEFAQRFDAFSIGTNDLTQLILGVDRDSGKLRHLFDERNPAVKIMIATLVTRAHRCGVKVGLCGQAATDHPDFAGFLVEAGVDNIAVGPDSVIELLDRIAMRELRLEEDQEYSQTRRRSSRVLGQ